MHMGIHMCFGLSSQLKDFWIKSVDYPFHIGYKFGWQLYIYTYIYIVAFCCGDPTLRTTQMLTCIIPTFDGIYFVATVDRSAGSLLYPKAPKQGFGCSQKSKSIYMYLYIYILIYICILIFYIYIYIHSFYLFIYVHFNRNCLGLGKAVDLCTYEICKHCKSKAAKTSWIASNLVEKKKHTCRVYDDTMYDNVEKNQ